MPMSMSPIRGVLVEAIVAVAMGDFLTLSPEQVNAVGERLGGRPGLPNQWVRLPDGSAISEKNPGYPYLAAPFEALGSSRGAPLG